MQLDSIENNLNHYWSNIKCPRTDGVNSWKSEWNSYGVCSGLKELDYFKAGLQLRKNADVLSALAEQGTCTNHTDTPPFSSLKNVHANENRGKICV